MKQLLRWRFALPALLSALFFYWLLAFYPYLRIEGCKIAAPYLAVRADRMGRISSAPHEEGARVERGDLLFSLLSTEELAKEKQLHIACEALEQAVLFFEKSAEKATQDYFAARSEPYLLGRVEETLQLLQEEEAQAATTRSELLKTKAELEELRASIAQKSVYAPFSGVIVKRDRRAGDVVQPAECIYILCDPDSVWVDAIVPETKISSISLGQSVRVSLRSGLKKQKGKISWIAPAALPTGEGVPIRVAIDRKEGALLPHLTADIDIKIH